MDPRGPLGAVEVRDGEFEHQIAKRRRVQDEGVEERDFDRQGSIAHVQFLGVGGEFVERAAPRGVRRVLVPAQVLEAHAAGRVRNAGAQAPVIAVMIRSTASSAMARTSSSLRFCMGCGT